MMTLEQIIRTFGVQYHTKEFDEKIIIDYYFSKLKLFFPLLTDKEFKFYINEDFLGGWEDCLDYNATGRRELKVLYSIIRHTKPKNILEIGTYKGMGLSHILLACNKNYQEGFTSKVTTLDITNFLDNTSELHKIFPFISIIKNSLDYLNSEADFDFIVQDGNHDPHHVLAEFSLFKKMNLLKYVWSHDYFLNNMAIGNAIQSLPKNFFKKSECFKEDAYITGFHFGEF